MTWCSGGGRIGTMCVADHRPRRSDGAELAELRPIGRLVEAEHRR